MTFVVCLVVIAAAAIAWRAWRTKTQDILADLGAIRARQEILDWEHKTLSALIEQAGRAGYKSREVATRRRT